MFVGECIDIEQHTFTHCALPFLRLRIPITITSKIVHHLLWSHAELVRVHLSELLQRECPAVQSRAEAHIAQSGIELKEALLIDFQ